MNPFIASALKLINRNGFSCTYVVVTEGTYNIETSSVTTTETNHTVTMYDKHIRANQYNYPDLIGKNSSIFYLANSGISFQPKVNDKIVRGSETFTVQTIVKYHARGELVFYKLIAVKG